MPPNRSVSLSRVFPCGMLDQLGAVLQQTAEAVEQEVFVLTEALLNDRAIAEQTMRFRVVVSRQFSGLLLAQASPLHTKASHDQLELTFAPEAIDAFLTKLSQQLQDDPACVRQLQQARQQLQSNDPSAQSEFTLRLAELLIAPQVQLQTQIQEQQHLLEQHVIQRTQELHDALLSAQTANRIKTEFLAAMSHELRTPLTCVIGMAETLLRVMAMKPETYALKPQKQQEYLKLIKHSGEHLLAMINDILDVSQVEAGKVILEVKPFSLSQIAHQSLQMLREQARVKGVGLRLHTLPLDASEQTAETDSFLADPRRVNQILLNLLSNAIKFTAKGGQVTLHFGIKRNTAVFQVEDTGIGIPEHQRHLLFQKFQQLDSSLTRTYEGTGLGLALTKQLVELHGGIIEVTSSVGVGSTFSVWLPAQSIAQPSDEVERISTAIVPNVLTTDASSRSFPAGGRVVLIEDHDETALLICDLLTAADLQVVWMVDGATAMKQIQLLQPRLIIANIELPDLESGTIARFLRQHPTLQATQILALIAEETLESQQGCLPDVDHYLTKPVQPYQLLDIVAALMGDGTE